MGKVCRVKQRTTVYKKRIGFRENKSKVTEDVSNVDNVLINTVNIQHILVKKFMIIINCQKAKIFMIIIKLLSRRSNLFFGNFRNFRNFRKFSRPQPQPNRSVHLKHRSPIYMTLVMLYLW